MTQHFTKNDLVVVRPDSNPTCLGDLVDTRVDYRTIFRVVRVDYGDNTILVESVNGNLEEEPVWLDDDCLIKAEGGNAKRAAARNVLDHARRSFPAEVVERLQETLNEALGSDLPRPPIGWELTEDDEGTLIRGASDYAIRVSAADTDGDVWLSIGAAAVGELAGIYVDGKALLGAVEWAIEAGNIRHAKSGDAGA